MHVGKREGLMSKRVTPDCGHESGSGAAKGQSRLGSVCSFAEDVVSAARRRSHVRLVRGANVPEHGILGKETVVDADLDFPGDDSGSRRVHAIRLSS